MNRLIWIVFLLILVPIVALGQTAPPEEPSPVEIVQASISTSVNEPLLAGGNGRLLILDLVNRSSKPIVGYYMGIRFFTDGKESDGSGFAAVKACFIRDPAKAYFQPGATWHDKIVVPSSIPKDRPFGHKVVIDFVLFKDNSAWGRDKVRQSLYIRGLVGGCEDTRSYYKDLLDTKGVQAVVDELKNN